MLRTETCGELRAENVGADVVLCGWVNSLRTFGGIVFIDLRDRYGITQVVAKEESTRGITNETVLRVKGKVKRRKEGMENAERATGDIEIEAADVEILSAASRLPIVVAEDSTMTEDTRLQYRYLDLRREPMQRNLQMRHRVTKTVRDYLDKEGFLEIETPMLTKSTPEGARDYLVPSRVHEGSFFALPQSPQLFKQLLMVSGYDRYFQMARCFRDEDLRADRQPEFTQIDIEMSFITEEDIFKLNEGMLHNLWKHTLGKDLKTPFPRITYREAMDRYGSDKPDVRFGLEFCDLTEACKGGEFKVLNTVIDSGGVVKAMVAPKLLSRKEIDELTEVAKAAGAKGLIALSMEEQLEGQVAKFLKKEQQHRIIKESGIQKGQTLLAVADKWQDACKALCQVRLSLGQKLGLIQGEAFLWVTDFPLLEWSEEEQKLVAMHHPFTSPKPEDLLLLDKDPGKVRARAYDIVLNGTEVGGGSIRISDPETQQKMFALLGIGEAEAKAKFGFLLDAFKFGAPPHGGIAYGLDRLVAIMTGNESIRDVIAFPKNKACQSLMDGAPSPVAKKQLDELHIGLKE
ncbi:MAG: aspartate--tRNA ligase [Nanoarchaeota archaeon]